AGIDGDKSTVIRADIDLALVHGDTTVDDVTATLVANCARHLRIVDPEPFAGASVDCVYDAPGCRHKHHSIDDEWRGFDAARRFEVVRPGETEVLYIRIVDLLELAEASFCIVEADSGPFFGQRFIGTFDKTLARVAPVESMRRTA